MEMPTSDSRSVSTLRDSVAPCVIALMATVLSRHDPALLNNVTVMLL